VSDGQSHHKSHRESHLHSLLSPTNRPPHRHHRASSSNVANIVAVPCPHRRSCLPTAHPHAAHIAAAPSPGSPKRAPAGHSPHARCAVLSQTVTAPGSRDGALQPRPCHRFEFDRQELITSATDSAAHGKMSGSQGNLHQSYLSPKQRVCISVALHRDIVT
jgi:hypothetical protein